MSLLIVGCFTVAALVLVIAVTALIVISKRGQGVSDARQGWIEGTSFQDKK